MGAPRPKAVPLAAALLLSLCAPAGAATIPVTTTADALANDGLCSLREAVIAANTDAPQTGCPAGSGADTITVPAGTYTLALSGASEDLAATGDLDLRAPVTVSGAGAGQTTVDAAQLDRAFDVVGTVSATLTGMKLVNGKPSGEDGGAVRGGGGATVALDGMTLDGNQAVNGGAIAVGGTVTVANSTISNNTGLTQGGGIDGHVSATLTNTVVSGNHAPRGAGLMSNGSLVLGGGRVTGNGTAATQQGGGIEADRALSITGTRIDTNTANNVGGGIWVDIRSGQTARIERAEIDHNTVFNAVGNTRGGGVFAQGHLDMVDSWVHDNTAGTNGSGGGLYFQPRAADEVLSIAGSTFASNGASAGGGLLVGPPASAPPPATSAAQIVRSTISGNTVNATNAPGGGLYVGTRITLTLSGVTLAGNAATGTGATGSNLFAESGGTTNATAVLVTQPTGPGADCVRNGTVNANGGNAEFAAARSCGFEGGADSDLTSAELGALADNGGPTLTRALLPGSRALGLGGTSCPATDQRGAGHNTPCDAGAFQLDVTPPVVTIVSGPSGTVSDPASVFGFSADENATFECSFDGGAFSACTSPFDAGSPADGPHTFSVRGRDVLGNQGAAVSRTYTIARAAPGGQGPGGTPSTPGSPSSHPVTNPGQVLLCAGNAVTLIDLRRRGRSEIVSGLALVRLAGRRVTITADHGGGKRTAKVARDGSFSARFPAPRSDQTSYTARYGRARSSPLKITRNLSVEARRRTAGGVRIVARHSKGARVRGQTVALLRATSCTKQVVAGTARFDRHGRVTLTLAYPQPPDTVAVYRVAARANRTFTLPIVVRRG